jgi:hypothetical protein
MAVLYLLSGGEHVPRQERAGAEAAAAVREDKEMV